MGWIDAHVHVWTDDILGYPLGPGWTKEQMAPPTFPPEALVRHCHPSEVDRIVLIQMSYYGFDNGYMTDVMHEYPGVFGGVAVVKVDGSVLADQMRALKLRGVRGFRVGVGKAPVAAWTEAPGFRTMFEVCAGEGMAVCPLIEPNALPSLRKMCDAWPNTTVVIDHLCRIGTDGTIRDEDVAALAQMAEFPNVNVKVSAFYALGQKRPPHDDLIPLIREMLTAYGARRLMWASDCPFQVGSESYEDSLALVRDRLALEPHDRDQLLRGTAERIFFRD